jgi:eukaryotic-like serine/threonine-protein kinase
MTEEQASGQVYSRYRIIGTLGAGCGGVVYQAEDARLRRYVALKFLPTSVTQDPQALARFQREAKSASALNHPNICTIYDFGQQDGRAFIAMEHLEGTTLKQMIQRGPLPPDRILQLGTQIAAALEAAHAKGVIHRDIKPANIFVTERGLVKILDFGLAKIAAGSPDPFAGSATLDADATELFATTPGTAIGTVAYMSPEQVRGEQLDVRTDLFSFGAVLYEMATGQMAFRGNTSAVVFDAILNRAPVPPVRLQPDLLPRVEAVINKALEKDRTLRYQQASEMRADLQRLMRDSDSGRLAAGPSGSGAKSAAATVRGRWGFFALAVLLIAAFTTLWLVRVRETSALTQKDTVVLADFTNKTGDPVFDDTLKQALAAALEQSPFLNILSERQVNSTLQLMDASPKQAITQQLAEGICQRAASKAVLAGSIASFGKQYVISLDATNCRTGETLARAEAQVIRKEDVLNGLTKAASGLRAKLGESLSSIQRFDVPLEKVTTPSLEALRSYALGRKIGNDKGDAEAIPLLKRAIELDPNFALAYLSVGVSYHNMGENRLGIANVKKAYELRQQVSEREKFSISGLYYILVTGQYQEAIETYKMWAQTYPADAVPYIDMGLSYSFLGQIENAVAATREAVHIDPTDSAARANLSGYLIATNRIAEAKANNQDALAQNLDTAYLRYHIYQIAFLEGDRPEMERQFTWSRNKPHSESAFDAMQSWTEAYAGRLKASRTHARNAFEAARRDGLQGTAANWLAVAAWTEAELGNPSAAREQADAALATTGTWRARALANIALSRAGASSRATIVAEDLRKDYPSDVLTNAYWLPAARAAVEIQRANGEAALEALRPAAAYDLADPDWSCMYTVYSRGQARLLLRQGNEAAQEFQKIIDNRNFVGNCPIGALAHLGLARAHALSGNHDKSRAAYQAFFTLWNDADPDLALLRQAKTEYSRLASAQSSTD